MKINSFDAYQLSSQLITDGFVNVQFSILKGRLLDQMIKTDLRLAYSRTDGRVMRTLLLAKGMVLTLFSSFFVRDVTAVCDFYVMNRSRINIRKGLAENGSAQFFFYSSDSNSACAVLFDG